MSSLERAAYDDLPFSGHLSDEMITLTLANGETFPPPPEHTQQLHVPLSASRVRALRSLARVHRRQGHLAPHRPQFNLPARSHRTTATNAVPAHSLWGNEVQLQHAARQGNEEIMAQQKQAAPQLVRQKQPKNKQGQQEEEMERGNASTATAGDNIHRNDGVPVQLPFVTRVDVTVRSDRQLRITPAVSRGPASVPSSAPLPVGKQQMGSSVQATQLRRGRRAMENSSATRVQARNAAPTNLDAPAWQTMPFDTSSATPSTALDASQARAGSPLACWLQMAAGTLPTSALRGKTPQAIEDLAVATNAAAPVVLRQLTSAPQMGHRQEPSSSSPSSLHMARLLARAHTGRVDFFTPHKISKEPALAPLSLPAPPAPPSLTPVGSDGALASRRKCRLRRLRREISDSIHSPGRFHRDKFGNLRPHFVDWQRESGFGRDVELCHAYDSMPVKRRLGDTWAQLR